MTKTVLVATWDSGLVAIRDNGVAREIPEGQVAGLASDGSGGALAIAGGKSLVRRAEGGAWTTLATRAGGLACSAALDATVFVGTDDARVLRLGAHGELRPLAGFDTVAGRETWYAGTAIIDGRVVGPP